MPCEFTSQEIIKGYEMALAMPENIRLEQLHGSTSFDNSTNSRLLQLSERVIRNSWPLYQALTTGAPLVVERQIVENLNSLQCLWAHNFVYSNRRDFIFARHVFHQTPQYRSTVKVRLGTVGAA
jgi:hypothetical protein